LSSYDRLTFVYHADGGVKGELSYAWGKLRGTAHCALCDITHGTVRAKPEWDTWRCTQPVQVDVVHLNERSSEIADLTDRHTPCVVAHTDGGLRIVLTAEELEQCGGDVDRFSVALDRSLADADLHPPADPFGGPPA
jgi:hypothetical protein